MRAAALLNLPERKRETTNVIKRRDHGIEGLLTLSNEIPSYNLGLRASTEFDPEQRRVGLR